jgi:hypothetical protein
MADFFSFGNQLCTIIMKKEGVIGGVDRFKKRSNLLFRVMVLFVVILASCDDSDNFRSDSCGEITVKTTARGDHNISIDESASYFVDRNANLLETNISHEEYRFETIKYTVRRIAKYNEEGFLMKADIDTTVFGDYYDEPSLIASNEKYTYAGEGLVKKETKKTQDGSTTNITETYEYNTDGQPTRYEKSDGSYKILEYSGTTLTKVTIGAPNGLVRTAAVEFNDEGLITRWFEEIDSYTWDIQYAYDERDQVTRLEWDYTKEPKQKRDYTYDTNKNPRLLTDPRLKGHPYIFNALRGFDVNIPGQQFYENNVSKREVFYAAYTGGWVSNEITTSTFEYDASGYPSREIIKVENHSNTGMETEINYTYSWCP